MRGNIVTAAAILGGSLVLASLILILGGWLLMGSALGSLQSTVASHGADVRTAGKTIESAVGQAGVQIGSAVGGAGSTIGASLEGSVGTLATSLNAAGASIAAGVQDAGGGLANAVTGHGDAVIAAGHAAHPEIPAPLGVIIESPVPITPAAADGGLPVDVNLLD